MLPSINCAEFEILLADRIDGNLAGDSLTTFETHASECAECCALARDAAAAAGFAASAETINAPVPLVNRILFEATQGLSRVETKPSWFARWFEPIVQPRFGMGLAMSALSFVMIGQAADVKVQQLTIADLAPQSIWTAAENRAYRIWDRCVKQYENVAAVRDLQAQWTEWSENAAWTNGFTSPPDSDSTPQSDEDGHR